MRNRHVFHYANHPQYHYCQDVHTFQKARFAYYLNTRTISHARAWSVFLDDQASGLFESDFSFAGQLSKLESYSADIFIVSAAYNRAPQLETLLHSIQNQQGDQKIAWIVVENGSSDETATQLQRWSKELPWMAYLQYKFPFHYATPARNRGLAFVQLAMRHVAKNQYIWVIDSDDSIHNKFVIHELYKAAESNPNAAMVHGYTICRYEDKQGNLITSNTIPRDIGAGFPKVPTLKDEFEMGPQLLSAFISKHQLPHFYYPDEFTMEDDTLSRRIMVWAKRYNREIISIPFPCLHKTFHFRSMSGRNDEVGDRNIKVQLGPKAVTGIRAQAVLGLKHVRDYFTREGI